VVTTQRGLGRYEILNEIGRGGMATVYLARQVDLGRLVALKELSAVAASDTLSARRFVRESRLAGSLNHPNIVTVHDFFEDHATPYIAMEFVERGALRPVIDGLTFSQVAGVIEGVLAGLAHAHARGIVHRDVKPENLMIADDSRIKVADFGIAKATDEVQARTYLTATGTTIGTPRYMAPEQAMGQAVGPWTDLYAVGMIAFEMFTGRLPFDTSGAPAAVLLRRVNVPPLRLDAVDPKADPRVADWIERLLVVEPEERTPSAAAAWAELEEIVLDRVGSRWRHAAALGAAGVAPAAAAATPPTMRLRDGTAVAAPLVATARPRAVRAAAPPPARPRGGGGHRPRLVARSLVLLMALVALAAGALSIGSGGGGGAKPAAQGTPSTQGTSSTQGTHRAKRHTTPSGVGDSRSDDPSDDEGDDGEP
jgi:hypothetical protein